MRCDKRLPRAVRALMGSDVTSDIPEGRVPSLMFRTLAEENDLQYLFYLQTLF